MPSPRSEHLSRKHSVIINERCRRPREYDALWSVLGYRRYERLEQWCRADYRAERFTPLLAAIDVASALVHREESRARQSRGFDKLARVLGVHLALEFALLALRDGREPLDYFVECCEAVSKGGVKRSRA